MEKENRVLSYFVKGILKTEKELNSISIPELYDISLDLLKHKDYYHNCRFNGIVGIELITTKQTILKSSPNVLHVSLYNEACQKIYNQDKLKRLGKISKINSLSRQNKEENINQITIRYINEVSIRSDKIDVYNYCIIDGDLNNINSYQKKILLETIKEILKKDPNTEIHRHDTWKETNIEDIMNIIPNDKIVLDSEEKLLTNTDDFVSDISTYHNKKVIDCFYLYNSYLESIRPIKKFKNYKELNFYDVDLLSPKNLNEHFIEGVRLEEIGIYNSKEDRIKRPIKK